jgi:hypothetical protein
MSFYIKLIKLLKIKMNTKQNNGCFYLLFDNFMFKLIFLEFLSKIFLFLVISETFLLFKKFF